MDEERKQEIAGFLRQRMVAEMKRFHEFADNMNGRAYYGGRVITGSVPVISKPHTRFIGNQGGNFITNEATAFYSNQVFNL